MLIIYMVFCFIIAIMLIAALIHILNIEKANYNSTYLKNRKIDGEYATREEKSIKALLDGEIKCHQLKSGAECYDTQKWVTDLKSFMNKPIFKQILSIKEADVDKEC